MTLTEPPATREPACSITVLTDRCAGCQECVIRCPTGALGIDPERWVVDTDDSLCVGCRQCERTCPFSAIDISGPVMAAPRTAARSLHPADVAGDISEIRSGLAGWDEARAEAARCLRCPDPTCVRGCPAHNDIPGFISAISDGDLGRAYEILGRTTTLPDVCSRVCDQATQCEGSCSWSLAGATPVAIGALERFVTEWAPAPPLERSSSEGEGLSVGIVGSGPAGIGAAHELLAAGAAVTVYEADDRPGGMLNWGIPEFTLPGAVRTRPWEALTDAGADLRCGVKVGAGDLDALLLEHDALILAHGAGIALSLPVPGADLPGVEDATSFLHRAKAALDSGGTLPDLQPGGSGPRTVLVLGAGNTAMDVARSAVRLGGRPICIDWMDRRYAPVRPDELAEAEEEGVEIRFSSTLEALEPSDGGRVGRARIARTVQKSAGERPEVVGGSTAVEAVDLVVMAMGYRVDPVLAALLPGTPIRRQAEGVPDRGWQASGILANRAPEFARRKPVGELALGREVALMACALPYRERTWVAGDALVGPSTVVEAMAQGRRAAFSILDSRPRGPASGAGASLPRVLVAYQSRGGRTRALAAEVADRLAGSSRSVRLLPLHQVGRTELASCDVLIVGTWVEGMVVAGVGPAKATTRWLDALPPLPGKRVGVFCSYGVAPRKTLAIMRQAFEQRGAEVVAEVAIGRSSAGGPASLAAAVASTDRVSSAMG